MDSTFQRPQHHHIRQGSPVYISDLAGAVQNIENQACGHNSVPPAEQRSGGALPQTVEKCAQSAHMRRGLGRSPAVGDAEDKGSPKRGFIHLSSKDGLWFTPHSAVQHFETATRSFAELTQGVPEVLRTAEMVYVHQGGVKPPLTPSYSGPYHVLECSPKVFQLQVGQREETVSADRLKLHAGTALVLPVIPPRRAAH